MGIGLVEKAQKAVNYVFNDHVTTIKYFEKESKKGYLFTRNKASRNVSRAFKLSFKSAYND